MLDYLESEKVMVAQQRHFMRSVLLNFYSVLVKEGKVAGVHGFVKVLEAMKQEGMKIHEDDLPRFLDRKFRKVSGVGVIIHSILSIMLKRSLSWKRQKRSMID